MNITIHKQLLIDLGIELSNENYAILAEHIDSTLTKRVNDEIVDYLDDTQLQELASLKDADTQTQEQWLTKNVPDLQDIIEDEIDILLGDIAEDSDNLSMV